MHVILMRLLQPAFATLSTSLNKRGGMNIICHGLGTIRDVPETELFLLLSFVRLEVRLHCPLLSLRWLEGCFHGNWHSAGTWNACTNMLPSPADTHMHP